MDAKNRVTVPSDWLSGGENVFHAVPSAHGEFLIVMPPEEFGLIEGKMQASDAPAAEKRKAIRQFYAAARSLSADKQGRVLIPEEHCTRVGLNGDVVLLGGRSRFEIWSAAAWAKATEEETPIYQRVADLIGL